MTYPRRAASRGSLFLVALAVGGLLSAGCGTQEGTLDTGPNTQVQGQTTLRKAIPSSLPAPLPSSGAATNTSIEVADPTLDAILRRALEQERYSEATYRNILRTFGPRNPFLAITESEVQHGRTLEALGARYGQDIGATDVLGEPAPKTMTLACQLAAKVETETISLYDGLLLRVTSYPEVTREFQNLRAASVNSHLPAFQSCAEGDLGINGGPPQ